MGVTSGLRGDRQRRVVGADAEAPHLVEAYRPVVGIRAHENVRAASPLLDVVADLAQGVEAAKDLAVSAGGAETRRR